MKKKKQEPPTPVRLDKSLKRRINKLVRVGLAKDRSEIIRNGTIGEVDRLEQLDDFSFNPRRAK